MEIKKIQSQDILVNMFKKKPSTSVDIKDVEKISIPVFFGGQQIGEVIHLKAKEIAGLEHLEVWIQLTFGSGIESQLKDIIINQGIYLGRPPE